MKNLNLYIFEKLHLDKDIDVTKSEIEQAYEIAKNILDDGEYKYDIDINLDKIHIDFKEKFHPGEHEPARAIGYISRDIRLHGLKFEFSRGKYPKSAGEKEWVEFYQKK